MRIILYNIGVWIINNLPFNHRTPKFILWCQSLVFGWVWNYTLFDVYRQNTTLLLYNPATTYAENFAIVYNRKIYISLRGGNTGNQPDGNPTWWFPVPGNFIGYSERIKYTGNYIKLTYQLNRFFSYEIAAAGLPGFIQPPYPSPYGGGAAFSSIYITNSIPAFTSGSLRTVSQTGGLRTTGNIISYRTIGFVGAISSYQFIVHVPLTVFNALGATDQIRRAIVTQFVNLYTPAGIGFTVVTY